MREKQLNSSLFFVVTSFLFQYIPFIKHFTYHALACLIIDNHFLSASHASMLLSV